MHWSRPIERFLVIYDQDRFRLLGKYGDSAWLGFWRCLCSARRQQDVKRRAIPRFAIDLYRAMVRSHDPEDGCQTEPPPDKLRRKERIEDSRQSLLRPCRTPYR